MRPVWLQLQHPAGLFLVFLVDAANFWRRIYVITSHVKTQEVKEIFQEINPKNSVG